MNKRYRPGATGALLDEYEKAITELQLCITGLSAESLIHVADATTNDPNCKSIQTVLAHVVHAAYGYALYIQGIYQTPGERPEKIIYSDVMEYINDLNKAFLFTVHVFEKVKDSEVEHPDKIMKTTWGQSYDIEQLMEHAIVHILRHRRQIEKFKLKLFTHS